MSSQCQSTRPALQKFYEVAGRSLFINALDEWSAGVVERYLREWYVTPAGAHAVAQTDASLLVRRGGPRPAIPHGLESFEVSERGRCFTDGRTYHLDVDGSVVRLAEGADGVEVWLREGLEFGSPSLSEAVFNGFSGALRRCGLFELHSGAVVEPASGRGALLVGASGSGKSTLTLQLAASGWGYLSDDVLLLSEREGFVDARPLRRVFAVTDSTVAAARLPRLENVRVSPVNNKRRFAPENFFPGGFAPVCRPEALFFPRVTHEGESRLRRLSQPEAMARLLKMCPWACYDRGASGGHLRALSLLARQADAFELSAGTDLLADPAHTSALLSGLFAR